MMTRAEAFRSQNKVESARLWKARSHSPAWFFHSREDQSAKGQDLGSGHLAGGRGTQRIQPSQLGDSHSILPTSSHPCLSTLHKGRFSVLNTLDRAKYL